MLRIGINLIKVDYNRETVIVHHLADDVTGRPLPVCGADIDDLTDGGPADGLLADIERGREPLFDDDSSRCADAAKPSTSRRGPKRRSPRGAWHAGAGKRPAGN